MATIFNMYKDIATPDVTADIRESRRESEANTRKTQETAFGMLKRSNIGTLQQQYREGKGRFAGITDPDKKFQVYYDALKALDPQAAQDAAKVYGEERQRRINREIADAYKSSETSGNPDIDNLRKKIDELKGEIDIDESKEKQLQAETEQKAIEQEQAAVSNMIRRTTPEQARAMVSGSDAGMTIDTGRMNQPIDTELGYSEGELQQDWSKFGYVPFPKYDLRRMYGMNPDFDISLSREGTQETAQVIDPRNQPKIGTGMEGYMPASRYDNYVPMTRSIANFYRGR